ncbi:MAG: DUF6777 domain-containing protein [Actinomycetota bacterium]
MAAAVAVYLLNRAEPAETASGEVFLQPSDQPGQDAFGTSVAQPPPAPLTPAQVVPQSSGGVVTETGTKPGLFAGVRNATSCNADALAGYLEANAGRGRPWALTIGINPDDIREYIVTLTPALLRVDTRVTEFGFRNGRAIARQAALQAGTAVLLDRAGFPRVRCASGNPMDEPRAAATSPVYRGPRWPAFSATTLVVIRPGPATTIIILSDVVTGVLFARIPGSIVIIDIDRPPAGVVIQVFQPGQTGNITGANWPPGTALTLTFDNPPVLLATTNADGAGNFSVPVTIPLGAAPGMHTINIAGGGFNVPQTLYVIHRGVRVTI